MSYVLHESEGAGNRVYMYVYGTELCGRDR